MSPGENSNLQPTVYKTVALPLSYPGLFFFPEFFLREYNCRSIIDSILIIPTLVLESTLWKKEFHENFLTKDSFEKELLNLFNKLTLLIEGTSSTK
jgi:hypothetical protein